MISIEYGYLNNTETRILHKYSAHGYPTPHLNFEVFKYLICFKTSQKVCLRYHIDFSIKVIFSGLKNIVHGDYSTTINDGGD